MSHSVVGLLSLDLPTYAKHAEDSLRLAAGFSWPQLAADTLDLYRDRLAGLRGRA